MTEIRYFFYVLAARAASSVIGGAFGWLIGRVSPEFVRILFDADKSADMTRLAIAVGLINGLLIGVGVMLVTIFLVTMLKVVGVKKTTQQRILPRAGD